MATNLTETTFPSTYKDDFADSAGFHKILFNSGKALQARELTQLQTILQDQISKFGNNIFKEGAVVKPGGATINQKYEFIKLNTTTNALPTDTESLIGTSFTGQTSGVKARVRDFRIRSDISVINPPVELKVALNSGAFYPGETIVGGISSATYIVESYSSDSVDDTYDSNKDIETEADNLLDFSEGNPFGDY